MIDIFAHALQPLSIKIISVRNPRLTAYVFDKTDRDRQNLLYNQFGTVYTGRIRVLGTVDSGSTANMAMDLICRSRSTKAANDWCVGVPDNSVSCHLIFECIFERMLNLVDFVSTLLKLVKVFFIPKLHH